MTLFIVLTLLLVVLQLYDFWSTHFVLTHGGRETIPWLAWLQKFIARLPFGGPWLWLVIAKTWATVAIGLGWYYNAWAGDGVYALAVIVIFYAAMLYRFNYRAAKQSRGR